MNTGPAALTASPLSASPPEAAPLATAPLTAPLPDPAGWSAVLPPDGPAAPIRVLVCDQSAMIRGALARMLDADPRIRVVARAADAQQAIAALRRDRIDVVVLDIEMPVMDGLTALPLLLRADPSLRVLVASTPTPRGTDIALHALSLGASDYLPKPSAAAAIQDAGFRRELLAKVVGLGLLRQAQPAVLTAAPTTAIRLRAPPAGAPRLLAIGSSTGGPQAVFALVQALGRDLPIPVVLTQHMPTSFTAIMADHITRLGGLPCTEAKDRDLLQAGHIYLAPGDRHLLIEAAAPGLRARLSAGATENYCRPAVDPMLRSACTATGGRVLVVMLTGMGQDGLAGTRQVIEAGGCAVAQDAATSVVWGMPGAIARAGLCCAVLPLPMIAGQVRHLLRGVPA